MNLKSRIFTIISLFLALNFYAQDVEVYKLNSQIKINSIHLSKSLPNIYGYASKKHLIGLSLFVDSKNNCYLKKHYTTDKFEQRDLGDKIDFLIFAQIVEKINVLDVENINYNPNIADGISYFLSFGDNKYSINLSAHTTGDNEKSDPMLEKFLEVFDFSWNVIEE